LKKKGEENKTLLAERMYHELENLFLENKKYILFLIRTLITKYLKKTTHHTEMILARRSIPSSARKKSRFLVPQKAKFNMEETK